MGRRRLKVRPASHNDIHLTYPKLLYFVRIYSGGGGSGRRFGTLGDDSGEDGDDEPQNYFAGGERR
jgi:hypothetical protein